MTIKTMKMMVIKLIDERMDEKFSIVFFRKELKKTERESLNKLFKNYRNINLTL